MTQFAFVFPGQGSQSRGMMNGYADFSAVRDTFIEASDVLKQDLWQLVAEGWRGSVSCMAISAWHNAHDDGRT
jgi:malonyl CoA-acyl carrier protein transacylase